MGHMKRVLSARPETVFVDRYGGEEFTVEELAQVVSSMIRTDTKEDVDKFCERFEVKSVI